MCFKIDRKLSFRFAFILCIAFGGIFLFGNFAAAATKDSNAAALSTARELIDHRQYSEAMPVLSSLVARQPDLIEAVALRGICYNHLDEFSRAVRDFSVYFKTAKEPAPLEFHRNYGIALTQVGKLTEALAQFNIDVAREPKRYDYRFDRTEVYLVLGQYDKALADANILVGLKPDPIRYAVRAKIYFKMHDYQKSAEDWTEALKRCPERRDLYEGRAKCYDKLGKPALAVQDRKKRDEDLE